MTAAQIFDTHTSCELAQDFLSNFVCNLHGLKNEARARVCVSGLFFAKVDLCQWHKKRDWTAQCRPSLFVHPG